MALRELDQEAVDRIVWAMTVAGLENAVELAELAMEETHFGVFEDKVLKNYIATEFLYDYLKDKKSVGVIDEDRERALKYVAEPIGVVLALLPITNPTSTALFKSIVCAKTRNALIMRPSARAARCAARAAEILQEAGEAAGLPAHALQVIPDPSLDVSQYLFHHSDVDFIWTTGGPKAVAAANAAGKPCLSVGSGNAPVYVHRSADIRMAVVDILVSKTFDSSVICPAEQTCVIDDQIYDQMIEEFQRMGARLLTDEQTAALAARSFSDDGKVQMDVLGQSCLNLGSLAGFEAAEDDKVLLAPLPAELDVLAAHPFIAEKLMPVLGVVRSPSVEHGIQACELVTEHGGLGHTSAVYATDDDVIDRFALAIRTGRILVNAPTAVGALGGIYNSMTPTFSLGLRYVGRVEHDRQRQLPKPLEHQDRVTPAGTLSVVPGSRRHVLQSRRARQPAAARRGSPDDRHRRSDRGPGRGRGGAPLPHRRRCQRVLRGRAGTDRGADPSRSRGAGTVRRRCDHRARRRLGDGCRQGDAAVPREPAAERPRVVAAVPRRAQANL